MRLVILGSGTCVPSVQRSAPANFLDIGGDCLLVDCGPGAPVQLEKGGLSYKNIDGIFLTHFHTDHVAALMPLIQALNWTPGYHRQKTLTLVGPPGTGSFFRKCAAAYGGKPRAGTYTIEIREIESHLEFAGYRVECHKTLHSPESIAYKFIEKPGNKSLVISGDCDYDDQLVDFCRGADLLLLECSFENSQKVDGHLTADECGLIARGAGARRLVLTHLYPGEPGQLRLRQAQAHFDATVLAEDLMEISI